MKTLIFLGFTSKNDIDEYGIKEFNQLCRETVWDNEAAFSKLTNEMGQFIEIPWLGGNWRDAVVPEPTALALLALGVAGLALRRKI